MIVAYVSDPHLRNAVCSAAHPEEEVVLDRGLAVEAFEWAHPRLVVNAEGGSLVGVPSNVPVVELDRRTLERWESGWRSSGLPARRLGELTDRVRALIDRHACDVTWVDRVFADLARAAGSPLPRPLRTFGRRLLEFPTRYTNLYAMAEACGMSRGALKARFRRRSLASPYTYLRWFRAMAVANALADRSVTVAMAAHRLGFTSDGNLCRTLISLTGVTPTEMRSVRGWNRLLITFAWSHLSPEAIEAWDGLEDLFERRAA